MANQTIYVVTKNGVVEPIGSTSLKLMCENHGLSYSMATKGKKHFVKGDDVYTITTVQIFKITGREFNSRKSKAL